MSPTVPPDLDDGHVRGVVAFGQGKHGALDLVGDVGDHLHGAAQVIAPAFLGDHVVVDGTGSGVVLARHGHVEVTLVVAQVQVGLGPVIGHEHFAVLEGIHGAGVNIDIRIQLLDGDGKSPGLQQGAQRSRGKALAQGRQHTARNKNELGFHELLPFDDIQRTVVRTACAAPGRTASRNREILHQSESFYQH